MDDIPISGPLSCGAVYCAVEHGYNFESVAKLVTAKWDRTKNAIEEQVLSIL